MKRIAAWLVALVTVAVITIGVMSDEGRTRPVPPKPATVDAGGPANGPVVSSIDGSVVADDSSSFDG